MEKMMHLTAEENSRTEKLFKVRLAYFTVNFNFAHSHFSRYFGNICYILKRKSRALDKSDAMPLSSLTLELMLLPIIPELSKQVQTSYDVHSEPVQPHYNFIVLLLFRYK